MAVDLPRAASVAPAGRVRVCSRCRPSRAVEQGRVTSMILVADCRVTQLRDCPFLSAFSAADFI